MSSYILFLPRSGSQSAPFKTLINALGGPLHSCIICIPEKSLRALQLLHGQNLLIFGSISYMLPSLCPHHCLLAVLVRQTCLCVRILALSVPLTGGSAFHGALSFTHASYIKKGFLKPCSCSLPTAHTYSLSFKKKIKICFWSFF